MKQTIDDKINMDHLLEQITLPADLSKCIKLKEVETPQWISGGKQFIKSTDTIETSTEILELLDLYNLSTELTDELQKIKIIVNRLDRAISDSEQVKSQSTIKPIGQ